MHEQDQFEHCKELSEDSLPSFSIDKREQFCGGVHSCRESEIEKAQSLKLSKNLSFKLNESVYL